MNVSVTITNTTSGIVCNIEDVLVWEGEIINWSALSNGGVLPVELLAFNGRVNENKIILNWETANEINNLGFDIEKSSNERDWKSIHYIKGQGNSSQLNNYHSEDDSPHHGFNY